MRKIGIFIFGLFGLVGILNASPGNFDIYGVDSKTKENIFDACSELMSEHLSFSNKLYSAPNMPDSKDLQYKTKLEKQIISKAKQFGPFSHAKVSSIYYPTDRMTFSTLDLVKSTDKHRLPTSNNSVSKKEIKVSEELSNLFSIWNTYVNKKFELMRKNQINLYNTKCPVMHCIWGFDKHEMKHTLPKLQQGVAKYKKELFEIIQYDLDDERREEAVFILAHGENYNEMAKFLINFTDDSSDAVRNNVMRVLGAIVGKYEVKQLDINRILVAMNYPYVTDRNKAAYVLLGLVKRNKSYHRQVIENAGGTLLALLKLKQPNNHDFAYHILREISHKTYGEHDFESWEQWIRSQQKSESTS